MKKIFLALAAVAALAACSKSEATYDDVQDNIGFAPVVSNRTKAMQTESAFPAEDFNVWAWYKQVDPQTPIADWQASTVTQQDYINEKPFTKHPNGLWAGATSEYYWPKVGSLLFAGYYPTTIADQVTYTFNATENKMRIVYYAPGFVTNAGTHEEDLMYFNMTPSSYQNATTGVEVTFRHALSWMQVVLVKDGDTSDYAKITVNSVAFTNVKSSGSAVVNNSPNIEDGETNEIVWTANENADEVYDPVVVSEDAGHILAKNNETPLAKQPLFIPQTMTSILVNYTITSTDGSQFTETKDIPLTASADAWQPGKKYIYTITIGTNEILIKPTVAEWVTVSVPLDDLNQPGQENNNTEDDENGENDDE